MYQRIVSIIAPRAARAPIFPTLSLLALWAASGCGPRFAPPGPGAMPSEGRVEQAALPEEADPAPAPVEAREPRPLGREILIGEMCPSAADGRPAVLPLFLRALTWSTDGEELALPIERRAVRQFSVLGWDGRRAGVFSVAGAADVGLDSRVAIGAYAGQSPCATGSDQAIDAGCARTQENCGLAVAQVERLGSSMPYSEDPEPLELPVASACVAGGKLLLDVDGDGITEAYPIADFLDPSRDPADEITAVATEGASCAPGFAQSAMIAGVDPKHFSGIDLLGAVDIDTDGRKELIVVYHYPERRTWAVYSAINSAGRLDLVGESVPWPGR